MDTPESPSGSLTSERASMPGGTQPGRPGSTITQADFLDTLTERFGPDPMRWAFICPSCGDVATGADFRRALDENPRQRHGGDPVKVSAILGQECIGRTLGALRGRREEWTGRGCDWAAYGLIGGPLTVVIDGSTTMSAFNIAAAER